MNITICTRTPALCIKNIVPQFLNIETTLEFCETQLGTIYYEFHQIEINDLKKKGYIIEDISKKIAEIIVERIVSSILKKYNAYKYNNTQKINNVILKIDKISNDIKTIIFEENYLDIDGYIKFRTSGLKKEIENIIIEFIIEQKIKKDYLEFIKLMRCYVETEQSKADIVHIIILPDNKYEIYDINNRNITQELIISYKKQYNLEEVNYSDCLIDTLIDLLPKKIIIHNIDDRQLGNIYNTIKLVFNSRISNA